jgi:hypothetical protein
VEESSRCVYLSLVCPEFSHIRHVKTSLFSFVNLFFAQETRRTRSTLHSLGLLLAF